MLIESLCTTSGSGGHRAQSHREAPTPPGRPEPRRAEGSARLKPLLSSRVSSSRDPQEQEGARGRTSAWGPGSAPEKSCDLVPFL